MNTYMLMFALGPVQIFIRQARKTRDLWLGSLLLSKLMEAAMADIKGQFIFPSARGVKNIPDIPNKYVALFDSQESAQQAAADSEKKIREFWEKICQAVWTEVMKASSEEDTEKIWKRQTNFDTLFEIYWAIVSRGEGQECKDYSVWLEETEGLLAARKRLRDFKPQNEPGEKSSISGEREILRGTRTDRDGIRIFWRSIANKCSANDIDQQGNERLDAIDIIKRFMIQTNVIANNGSFNGSFPSTSSIATASFMEKLLDSEPKSEAFAQWQKVTKKYGLDSKSLEAAQDIPYLAGKASEEWQWLLRRDGDLYFPAVFAPRRLMQDYHITESADTIKHGKVALAKLLDATDVHEITRPTPYYAIIQMDGDNMGMLLSGTRDEKEHEAISTELSKFARTIVPELVEGQYPARLVYAGGDDVLAFAPIARDVTNTNQDQPLSILVLADELQSRYRMQIKDVIPSAQALQDEKREYQVTASVGIAIAHHYTSLSYVLRSAREAEFAAKHLYNRNALVVTILRRSGEQTRVGCHWHYPELDDNGQPIKLFSRFLTLFKDDILSPKCVYILLEEISALIGLEQDAKESEIRRVLLRQLNLEKKAQTEKDEQQKEIRILARYIVELAEKMDPQDEEGQKVPKENLAIYLHSTGLRHGIVEVLGWLLVMAFLARKDQGQE